MSELNLKEIFNALQQVASHNLMNIEELKNVIKESVFKSFHTKFDPDAELEMRIDETNGEFTLVNKTKIVVEDEEHNPLHRVMEVPLSEAKKIDPSVEVGDMVSEPIDFASYSKNISQQIRQMVTQSVREYKKEAIWEKHQFLKGQMIDVTVQSITDSFVIFSLEDGTTAFMPSKLRNIKIPLKIGEITKVFVEDVLKESRDSQIIVSNGSPIMVRRLLELEVPEIANNSIEIVNISRIAGERSKIAVRSKVENVDPVGAIIGSEGSRINGIISKLNNEKIDIILYSDDLNTYIANSLSPARIISVIDKKDASGLPIKGHKIAIAPNRHQTLAIGKMGSNVRLAVELVNSRIDVLSYDDARRQGIEIDWNGNISPTDFEALEAGEKIYSNRRPARNFRLNANSANQNNPVGGGSTSRASFSTHGNKISTTMFDEDITSFNNEINIDKPAAMPTQKTNEFKYEDSYFSEDELRQMEANFELDDDLSDFDPDADDTKEISIAAPEMDDDDLNETE